MNLLMFRKRWRLFSALVRWF